MDAKGEDFHSSPFLSFFSPCVDRIPAFCRCPSKYFNNFLHKKVSKEIKAPVDGCFAGSM